MAIIRTLRGKTPKIGTGCFLAENCAVLGDVVMGDECSIWYGATLRGDVNSIRLGNRVNVQDGAVIHTLYERSVTVIGDNVSLGHNAVVHGATIEDNCLIGINATVLDNAVVGSGTIVAANALVLSNSVLEPHSIYAGVPARKVKEISPEQSRDIVERIANDYVMYASWYEGDND
ncbi:MAG: gamma carbonic anhydrase family protein [Rikenellaceae bacterium]